MISPERNEFGCGYCRRKGGPQELVHFVMTFAPGASRHDASCETARSRRPMGRRSAASVPDGCCICGSRGCQSRQFAFLIRRRDLMLWIVAGKRALSFMGGKTTEGSPRRIANSPTVSNLPRHWPLPRDYCGRANEAQRRLDAGNTVSKNMETLSQRPAGVPLIAMEK